MTAFELLTIILSALVALIGGVYVAVRLAIRAEVQALELRIAREFVTKETCRAIREDCERYHRAKETQGKA